MNLNYRQKRILLSLVWTLFNIIILSSLTIKVLGTGWELVWLTGVILYTTSFWILTSMLLDALIGPEVKNG